VNAATFRSDRPVLQYPVDKEESASLKNILFFKNRDTYPIRVSSPLVLAKSELPSFLYNDHMLTLMELI
jgi:hypothetical protein